MIRQQLLEALAQVVLGPAAQVVADSDAAFLVFVVTCCLGGLGLGAGIAWTQIKWMRTFGLGLKPLAATLFGLGLAAFAAVGLGSLAWAFLKG